MNETSQVASHYDRHGLVDRLRQALNAAGFDSRRPTPTELAPLDQFHSRGLAATVELAEQSGVKPGDAVIDIGSGLGGPSRYLAATYGCRVAGVDLSAPFVEAATFLAEQAGLSDQVSYVCGDALALPYPAATFDLAWTQHVAMNIADRPGLYAEAYRVIRPGGRFVVYDIVAGFGGALHFPVPWSRGPETSFLLTPDQMRAVLAQQGFRVLAWDDRTEAGVSWFEAQRQRPAPALGLHVAMGAEFATMSANLLRNLREGRAGLLQAVLEKPPA